MGKLTWEGLWVVTFYKQCNSHGFYILNFLAFHEKYRMSLKFYLPVYGLEIWKEWFGLAQEYK